MFVEEGDGIVPRHGLFHDAEHTGADLLMDYMNR